jgi:putative transposase
MDQLYDDCMQRLQAFKFELLPNGEQERTMRRFAGACRFVYNEALALQKARYECGEKKLGYAGLCKLLTAWRNSAETPWLRDAPTHPLQQAMARRLRLLIASGDTKPDCVTRSGRCVAR